MVIGIAVPSFAYRLSIKTRYHSGGQSSKVLKRGVVGGRVALQIKIRSKLVNAYSPGRIIKSGLLLRCSSDTSRESLCSILVQSLKQRTTADHFVFGLRCSSNSHRREIISLDERTHASKFRGSHFMSH